MEANQVIIFEERRKWKEIPAVEDFENICRICLINFTSLDIPKRSIDDVEDEIKIKSLLEYYTPIKISDKEDYLPQHLCIKCTKYLIDIHVFQCTSLLNEDLLHKIWQKSQKQQQTNQDVQQNQMNTVQLDQLDQANYTHSRFMILKHSVKNTINKLNDEIMGIVRCHMCQAQFRFVRELTKHKRIAQHSKKPTCPCPYCGKMFNSAGLKEHIRIHTKEKPLVCVHCNAAFTHHANLTRHLRIHSTEKPICEICGKKFSTIDSLNIHWKIKHVDDEEFPIDTATNSYKCVICKKSFETNDAIKEHMLSHKQTYLCATCGKCFRIYSQLTNHERIHTFGKSYKCTTCDKFFVSNSELKIHELVHTTDRPYECTICHQRLKSKSLLNRHRLARHERKRVLPCVVCGEKFTNKLFLRQHMKIHKDLSDLRKFECEICKKRYLKKGHLKLHLLTHTGERRHVCKYCGKAYMFAGDLTVHTRSHTGERPYKCRVCFKGFKESSSCKQHERNLHSSLDLKNAMSDKGNLKQEEEDNDHTDVVEIMIKNEIHE